MALYTTQILLFCIYSFINVGYATFSVKSFEDCNPGTNYPVKMDGKFKMVKHKQVLDMDIELPIPLDDTIQLNFTVEALMNGGDPIRLLSDIQKDACSSLHKYFGQFMFDIEKLMNIEPGVCPIPKGTYHLHHYPLNFDRLTFAQNFPLGNIQAVLEATNTKDNSIQFCKITRLTNDSR